MTNMTIEEILAILPHRYPFILVDKVMHYQMNKSLTARKNVSINEPFFQGHFPGKPVMPGVLMVEALAQAAGILTLVSSQESPALDNLFLLASLEKVRFRQVVQPGDVLTLQVDVLKARKRLWKVKGSALVGEDVVCDAELMIAKAADHG